MEYIFDIVVALLLFLFALRGFLRGFIREISGLLGIMLGLFLAVRYHSAVATHLDAYVDDYTLRLSLAYILVFLAVVIAVWLVSIVVTKILSVSVVTWINHALGAIVGFAKAVLLCTVGIALTYRVLGKTTYMKNSVLAPYFDEIVTIGRELLPPVL